MRTALTLAAAALLAVSVSPARAQSAQEHAAHHPDGASAPVAAAKAPPKTPVAKAKAAAPSASAASSAMGMGGRDMKQMQTDMHKPGGMREAMHGKDGHAVGAMPAASAATQ